MFYYRPAGAAIFDVDGLWIGSAPLWPQAELKVLNTLDIDLRHRAAYASSGGANVVCNTAVGRRHADLSLAAHHQSGPESGRANRPAIARSRSSVADG